MLIKGKIDLCTGDNFWEGQCLFREEYPLYIAAIGDGAEEAVSALLTSYAAAGADALNDTDSMFLVVLYDRRDRSLHAFSDLFSGPLPLYYTVIGNTLFYSTSLKWLLASSGVSRELDPEAVNQFLTNGFVIGDRTLLRNVGKLKLGFEWVVKDGIITQIAHQFAIHPLKTEEAAERLLPTIRQRIRTLAQKCASISIPLSSGYDSNLVLDTLRSAGYDSIHAFTVGGEKGRSEIGAVTENVSEMKEVTLHTETVDYLFFDKLADIVWRLEGCVYESGIFLQYALARRADWDGMTDLICGECADQVMSGYLEKDIAALDNGRIRNDQRFLYYCNPYIMGNFVVLRKSSVMLNSFHIRGHYPFAGKRVVECAEKLKKINGKDKAYYKQQCRKEFPPRIVSNIQKIGGSTTNQALMSDEFYATLKMRLETSKIAQHLCRRTGRVVYTLPQKLCRIRQLTEWVWRDIRAYGPIKGIRKTLEVVQSHDMGDVLRQLYLIIFYDLFITGKYDSEFDASSVSATTTEIIDQYI